MANRSRHGPLLCPGCRKLVSADERQCPHCGLRSPGSRWKHPLAISVFSSDERLIHTIIAASVLFYLLSLLVSSRGPGLTGNPMTFLAPDSHGLFVLGATGTIPIDRYHRWWTLLSAAYLHGGLLHIMFNMLALRQIGPLVVREYGTHRTLIIYTLSSMAGFLLSYLAGISFTIGASAAVCGLIGGALYYGKSRGGIYGQGIYRQVGGWALGIFLFGFLVPGINNWAHGGGMAAGILLGRLVGYRERRPAGRSLRLLGGICLSVTAAVLLWASIGALVYR
jgi:rhomboid protease GluP